MSSVTRRDRLVDLASLGLILCGAALCVIAFGRLQEISKLTFRNPGPRSQSALAAADRARYLAYGGVVLLLGGFAAGIAGAVRVSVRKRRANAPAGPA